MPRREYHDDFRVEQRNGRWVIWIRSSPEDMEEYGLEKGVREILKRVRRWEAGADSAHEAAHEAEEKARVLTARAEEGLEVLRPLVEADVLDELGIEYPWEYFR